MLRALGYVVSWAILGYFGVILGYYAGFVWMGAAMVLAGGGNAHADLEIAMVPAYCGALIGPIAPPLMFRFLRRQAEQALEQNDGGATTLRIFRFFILPVAIAAFFLATSLGYYAVVIAELPVEYGGPSSSIPGAVRSQLASIGSVVVGTLGIGLLAWGCWRLDRTRARPTPSPSA